VGSNPTSPTMREKGQMQIIFGIGVFLLIVGIVWGITSFKGGEDDSGLPPEETVESAGDAAAPIRSNLFPSGTLPAGTTETKISVSINEPGYCRYSTESGQTYDSMKSRFSYDKDKTFHTAKIKKLKNGQTYTFYVRCRDLAGNKNNGDAIIQFSIGGAAPYYTGPIISSGSDETPPGLSNLFPTGTLPAGTTETQISVNTNEPAYCRYTTESGQTYDSMKGRFSYDKDKIFHTATVKGLTDNKIYEYFVRCRDLKGNKNTNDAKIRFGVGGATLPSSPIGPGQDNTPPYCYDASPTEDDEDLPFSTKQTTISLKTDEQAVCRYSTVSGMSYDAMNRIFSNTDALFHSTLVTGLSEGQEYEYYVKCVDEKGNKNTNDFVISFKVESPEDVTPPKRIGYYPTGDSFSAETEEITMSVWTDEPATCRYSTEQGTSYKSMKKTFSRDEAKTHHTATIKDLESGRTYEYFVRCKDLEDNVNTGDIMIYFSVR
jgi:hypothetical protein